MAEPVLKRIRMEVQKDGYSPKGSAGDEKAPPLWRKRIFRDPFRDGFPAALHNLRQGVFDPPIQNRKARPAGDSSGAGSCR